MLALGVDGQILLYRLSSSIGEGSVIKVIWQSNDSKVISNFQLRGDKERTGSMHNDIDDVIGGKFWKKKKVFFGFVLNVRLIC